MAYTYVIPKHRRGDTWNGINSIVITSDGSPVNLTGASIKMELREDIDAPVALTLSTEDGTIVINDPLQGTLTIPPILIDIPFGNYLYDLQITFANGVVKTYLLGTWEIVADITK
jgi:hypothetical protein